MPAPTPQPAAPSGVCRENSLPAYPPGQGCGHDLRPGARFCTVCGRPAADDAQRTGLVAQQQAPARGPETTAIRPVPAPPEPVNLHSPATLTDRPSERSSGGGVGSGPQWGWPDPSPAPGGAMPHHGDTTPRQDHRHRSRWPFVVGVVTLLAAGAAAVVVIVQPFQHSQAAASVPRTAPAAPGERFRPQRLPHRHQRLPHRHRNPRNRGRRASPGFSRRVPPTAVPPCMRSTASASAGRPPARTRRSSKLQPQRASACSPSSRAFPGVPRCPGRCFRC